MKRLCLLTIAIGLLAAAPARAHEEINPSTFPVGRPAFLTVIAANEKQVKLTRLTVIAPAGITFGVASRDPSGWTSSRTATTVAWTGGSVDPGHYESFGFELEEAGQPGVLTYRVTLGYVDGSSEDASVNVTATAGTASPSPSSGGATGRANLALALGAAGLALSVVALARARGRAGAAPVPAAGTEQDW